MVENNPVVPPLSFISKHVSRDKSGHMLFALVDKCCTFNSIYFNKGMLLSTMQRCYIDEHLVQVTEPIFPVNVQSLFCSMSLQPSIHLGSGFLQHSYLH